MKETIGVAIIILLILADGGLFDELIEAFIREHPIITAILFLVAIIGPWRILGCGCLTIFLFIWFIL